MLPSFFVLAATGSLASAHWVKWRSRDPLGRPDASRPPRETGSSQRRGADGWTPRPTSAPGGADRFRRHDATTSNSWLDDHTCGWVSGTRTDAVALTCPDESTCSTNDDKVVGCALPGTEVADDFFTVCYDYQAYLSGACDGIGPGTGCCQTSSFGACGTYLWPGSPPRSMLRCFDAPTTISVLDAPPQTSEANVPLSRPADTSSESVSVPDPTSSGSTASTALSIASGIPDSSRTAGTNNIGAIVGGALGGLAVLALIVAALAFLSRRQRHGSAVSAGPGPRSGTGIGPAVGGRNSSIYSVVASHDASSSYPDMRGGGGGGGYQSGASRTSLVSVASLYDPHQMTMTTYYDPVHGGGGGVYDPHLSNVVVAELDTSTVAAGQAGNPAEMASHEPIDRKRAS